MKTFRNFGVVVLGFMSILITAQGLAYAAGAPSDIGSSKYQTAIEFLYDEGVVSGYDDGTFRPDYELNRAELVKFVAGTRGKDIDATQYKNCFPDVNEEWYAKYVCYAKSEGWVHGYPDGFFRPGNKVNKVEAMKIAVIAFGMDEGLSNGVDNFVELPYSDLDDMAWYYPYFQMAYWNDLIEETSGRYQPSANMTRGQISEVVYRVLRSMPEDNADSEGGQASDKGSDTVVGNGSSYASGFGYDSDTDTDSDAGSGGSSGGSGSGAGSGSNSDSSRRTLTEDDLTYLGSFRLPSEGGGDSRFGFGGSAMALNPDGDANGANDGFPGSLYISGHEHDQLVAEVNIPVPKDQRDVGVGALNSAAYLQQFGDITEGMAASTDEGNGYRVDGLAYFDGNIYWTARTYYNVDTSSDPSHGVSDLDLSNPNARGLWRLEDFHSSMTSGYIFPVPSYFADAYLDGKRLITGLFTQQGVSATSQGPAFFAYAPWQDAVNGVMPAMGAVLDAVGLVYYPYALPPYSGPIVPEPISNFPDYQVPDRWDAAAWLSTDSVHGVVVVGRRSMGETYYGDARPDDCDIYKGYHGDPYEPRMAFYDPADLASAAEGDVDPWDVLPYLEWDPSEYIVETCDGELTGAVYDEENRLFYVLQVGGDTVGGEPQPLIYVWRVE